MAQVTAIASEPSAALAGGVSPARRSARLAHDERVGREHFSAQPRSTTLPGSATDSPNCCRCRLPIKQSMLEINDSEVRLKVIAQFLVKQGVLIEAR